MPRRSSSTSGFSAGVFENISGNIDNVVTVGENIDIIKQLMDMPGFEDLLIEVRETLDFTNITVVSGTEASWNSDTKVLTVPTVKGDKGDSLAMSSVVDNGNSTFTWGFSDGTLFTTPDLRGTKGDTGVQGEKGDQGEKGLDAVPLTLVDITDNGNYTFDWEFSDGFVYTTPALRGHRGDKGEKGDSLSLDGVEHIGDGIFTWTFSDGTVFTTPRLKGDQGPQGVIGLRGLQGERGIGVHHMKATSTTELNGDFGAFGEKDTYTFYGDADETMVLGWFTVMNGINSAEDLEAVGVMTRRLYDTNSSGVVDNSEALGGKTLAKLEQERDELLDLKLDKAGGTIENDLTIQGNLYVNGTETVVNTETVEVADNEIVINAGEPGTGVTKGTAGIRVDRGSAPDYLFQFDETSDSFKVGEESSLQQIATREDTPLDAGVAVWDDSSSRFRTTKDLDIDSLNTTGLVNGRDIPTDGTKLDGIEEEATADQTAEEIEALYESNPDTNKYTDQEKQFVDVTTTLDTVATTLPAAVNEVHAEVDSVVDGTTDIVFDNTGTFIAASTLEGAIKEVSGEVGDVGSLDTLATTIVGAVNELYTELDSADSRLDALELDSHTHSNKSVLDGTTASYTTAEETKLDGIEAGAKDDQVASEVPVTSTGNLKSTDVQSALEELQLDVDTINSDLGTKVDKIVGKGLSDTNFTQDEKTKLAAVGDIERNFVNDYLLARG